MKQVTVDGVQCTLTLIDPFEALRLDRKVAAIVAPIAAPIIQMGLDEGKKDVEFDKLLPQVVSGLSEMPDHEYMPTLEALLSTVTVVVPGQPATQLTREGLSVLKGRGVMVIYKICVEVMKYNKLLPFDLASGLASIGNLTQRIAGLNSQMQTTAISNPTSEE